MNRTKIEKALTRIGISANLKGFIYIVDALEVIEKVGVDASITKVIYPEIAKMHIGATPSKVERAIRHALSSIENGNGDTKLYEELIGTTSRTNNAALVSLFLNLKEERVEESTLKPAVEKYENPDSSTEMMIRKVVRQELQRIFGNVEGTAT